MRNTNYVGIASDWKNDKLIVWERPIEGGPRSSFFVNPPRYFYVPAEDGEYTSIFNDKLSKLTFDSKEDFNHALDRYKLKFESDISPSFRYLMDNYFDVKPPKINFALLDIEADVHLKNYKDDYQLKIKSDTEELTVSLSEFRLMDKSKYKVLDGKRWLSYSDSKFSYHGPIGFPSPENPYAPINAISIFQSWTGEYVTIAVPPKGWTGQDTFEEDIKEFASKYSFGFTPKITIVKSEKELLQKMYEALHDSDIISGWNSELFDLPYILERTKLVLGERAMSKMCFDGAPKPKVKLIERFGKQCMAYTIYGRTHLDYLDMFKKFTFDGRVSYSLANIAAEELDIPKIEYEGTLESLYNDDFVHFVGYNIRDTQILEKLDEKFSFIELVNQMAHENTCLFENILGTVRYVETGIMNRGHYIHNKIFPDKAKIIEENKKVEGAIVLTPLAGLHKRIGSVDITSLYPSVARSLNMSLETFFGQFENGEVAWEGIYKKTNDTFFLHINSTDEVVEKTGVEWWQWLRDKNYACSAFGTVFDQNQVGIMSDTLTFWFNERIRLKNEQKKWGKEAQRLRETTGIEIDF